jgi:hypothetical protein
MPLYHCSPAWLEPGSVIRPGNYGRVLKLNGPKHNHWLREEMLEFVRKHAFPDKPSRLYEVRLTDQNAKTHVTDFNCVAPIQGKIEDMHEMARHYWALAPTGSTSTECPV